MDSITGDETAARYWAHALDAWAIPQHILDAAPESPWGYPTAQFARRADAAMNGSTPSPVHALAALPRGGTVLDVGCGAGAASLPLAGRAAHLVGIDPSAPMLSAFRERAEARGLIVTTLQGSWPTVAAAAPIADVVVCHHVAYNVSQLAPFARTLTNHARWRVVLELTAEHPLASMNDLWLRFHGLPRPTGPDAGDAIAVLREAGLEPEYEHWVAPALTTFDGPEELVAWTRRRLCLPASRDAEIALVLAERASLQADGPLALPPRSLVTAWWPGRASAT